MVRQMGNYGNVPAVRRARHGPAELDGESSDGRRMFNMLYDRLIYCTDCHNWL